MMKKTIIAFLLVLACVTQALAAQSTFYAYTGSGNSHGYVEEFSNNSVYPNSWYNNTAQTFTNAPTPGEIMDVMKSTYNGSYYFYRVWFLRFDTSSLPDGATITSATLTPKYYNDAGTHQISGSYANSVTGPAFADWSRPPGTTAFSGVQSTSGGPVAPSITLSNPTNISRTSYTIFCIGITSPSETGANHCWINNQSAFDNMSLVVDYSTAPGVPGNPTFTNVAHKSMTISWTAATGATSYTLQRGGSNISTSATSPYNDTGLAVNTSYTYRVIAVNADGSTNCAADQSQTTTYYDKSFNGSGAIKTINGVYIDTLNGQN